MAKTPTPAADVLTLPATLLAPATVGVPYTGSIEPAEGGQAPISYAVTAGALPEGFVLGDEHQGPSGVVCPAPASVGDFAFEVTATDAAGIKIAREYGLKVIAAEAE